MIRVDALWLAVEPLDLRAGTEAALARVVTVFGAARVGGGIDPLLFGGEVAVLDGAGR